jgi:hypothetical protein
MTPALLVDLIVGTTGPGYAVYYFMAHIPHHVKTGNDGDPDLHDHACGPGIIAASKCSGRVDRRE